MPSAVVAEARRVVRGRKGRRYRIEEKNIAMVHVKYRTLTPSRSYHIRRVPIRNCLPRASEPNIHPALATPTFDSLSSDTRQHHSDLAFPAHTPRAMNFVHQGDSGPAAAARSPPIVELARFLTRALTLSYGVLSRTTVTLIFSLLAPLSLIFTPISYLLSPVFILIQVLLDVFVFTPYSIIAAIARNFYPLYVFFGSAVISALVLGFAARTVASVIVRVLFAPRSKAKPSEVSVPEPQPEREAPPPPEFREKEKEKGPSRATVSKTRTRKRVSIREERDK